MSAPSAPRLLSVCPFIFPPPLQSHRVLSDHLRVSPTRQLPSSWPWGSAALGSGVPTRLRTHAGPRRRPSRFLSSSGLPLPLPGPQPTPPPPALGAPGARRSYFARRQDPEQGGLRRRGVAACRTPRALIPPGSSRLPGSPLAPTSRPRTPSASSRHKCQRTAAAPMLAAGRAGCGRAGHGTLGAAAPRALLSAASSATAPAPEPHSRRAGQADSRALIGPRPRGAELRGRPSSGRRVAWPAGVWARPLARDWRQVGGGSRESWGRRTGCHPGPGLGPRLLFPNPALCTDPRGPG